MLQEIVHGIFTERSYEEVRQLAGLAQAHVDHARFLDHLKSSTDTAVANASEILAQKSFESTCFELRESEW